MNPAGAIATGARPSDGRALLCKALFNQMFQGRAQRGPTIQISRPTPARPASFPLPAGEGKGEGERVLETGGLALRLPKLSQADCS